MFKIGGLGPDFARSSEGFGVGQTAATQNLSFSKCAAILQTQSPRIFTPEPFALSLMNAGTFEMKRGLYGVYGVLIRERLCWG